MVRLGIKKKFLKIFSQLSFQQKEDLDLMREDNFKSSFHYQSGPGKGWQKIVRELESHFHKEGIKVSGDNLYPYPKNWKKQFLRYPNEWPGYFKAAFKI